jgi:predicted ATP-binding protein involved in virulence
LHYSPIDRLNYIKYWDEKIDKLNHAIKNVDKVTNLTNIISTLSKYERIRESIDHLTDLLSDMNALTPEIHSSNGFHNLIGSIEQAIDEISDVPEFDSTKIQSVVDVSFNNRTWEECAASLLKTASDTEKLMLAVFYHINIENNDAVEIATIKK